jgi:Tfp pilus assembly PilM family ATPase
MSRLVSIECDSNEVRVAVGTAGLTGLTLEHVVSAPVALDSNEEPLSSPKIAAALAILLKGIGVKSGHVVFCVGRGNIEIRSLTLPTTDKNELPDMVRFAAMRQFANVGDHWPIDFVVLPSQQENMSDCMAASINPSTIERLGTMVESLGLHLSHIVLRPMASAMLAVTKLPQLANSSALLIELFRDEVDMAVLEKGQVVFMRNVRLSNPVESQANLQSLQGEIKRTLIAAASQRANLQVEQIRVWGNTSQHSELCNTLSASLGQQVDVINPFDLLDASKQIRSQAGEGTTAVSSKFASTMGALLAPQVSDRIIDFSNPRKKEEAKNPLIKYAVGGAAAATLLTLGYGWHWMTHSSYDADIALLDISIAKNAESLKIAAKKQTDWKKVETFLAGDYLWLDELEYLSAHASTAEKTVFGATTLATDQGNNVASISTKFITKEQEDVPVLQDAFRDESHTVRGNKITKSQEKSGEFPVMADLTIKLRPIQVLDPRKANKAVPVSAKPVTTEPVASKPEDATKPSEMSNQKDAPKLPEVVKPDDAVGSADAAPKSEPTPSANEPPPAVEPVPSPNSAVVTGGAN